MAVVVTCPRCNGTGDDPGGGACKRCGGDGEIEGSHRDIVEETYEKIVDVQDKVNDIFEKVNE